MILGRFPTSSDKPNVHNILAVTVTMGGGFGEVKLRYLGDEMVLINEIRE